MKTYNQHLPFADTATIEIVTMVERAIQTMLRPPLPYLRRQRQLRLRATRKEVQS